MSIPVTSFNLLFPLLQFLFLLSMKRNMSSELHFLNCIPWDFSEVIFGKIPWWQGFVRSPVLHKSKHCLKHWDLGGARKYANMWVKILINILCSTSHYLFNEEILSLWSMSRGKRSLDTLFGNVCLDKTIRPKRPTSSCCLPGGRSTLANGVLFCF